MLACTFAIVIDKSAFKIAPAVYQKVSVTRTENSQPPPPALCAPTSACGHGNTCMRAMFFVASVAGDPISWDEQGSLMMTTGRAARHACPARVIVPEVLPVRAGTCPPSLAEPSSLLLLPQIPCGVGVVSIPCYAIMVTIGHPLYTNRFSLATADTVS